MRRFYRRNQASYAPVASPTTVKRPTVQLVVYLSNNRRLRVFWRRRLDWHQRHIIDIDLGFLGFLLLTLLFLAQAQLLAVSLEFSGALCLLGRRVPACKAIDGDTRIQTIRIRAGLRWILIALHEHAVESNPILHEIGYRHRRNSLRTAGRHTQCNGGQTPEGDD